MPKGSPRFICPRCGLVSWHPKDLEEGYCGRCHDWTAPPEHDDPPRSTDRGHPTKEVT